MDSFSVFRIVAPTVFVISVSVSRVIIVSFLWFPSVSQVGTTYCFHNPAVSLQSLCKILMGSFSALKRVAHTVCIIPLSIYGAILRFLWVLSVSSGK
jgi:hypothetical protein